MPWNEPQCDVRFFTFAFSYDSNTSTHRFYLSGPYNTLDTVI